MAVSVLNADTDRIVRVSATICRVARRYRPPQGRSSPYVLSRLAWHLGACASL